MVTPTRLTKGDEPRGSNDATACNGELPLPAAPFPNGNLWRKKLNAVSWARSLAVLSLFAVGAAVAEDKSLAAHVRAANDRFKDVAVAVSEGYAPIPCASGVDGGAMGVHYV